MRFEHLRPWSLSLLCLVACTGASAQPAQPGGNPVQPTSSLVGPHSAIVVAAYHRVRSPEALQQVWQQHTAGQPPSPVGSPPHPASLPAVDFATSEVVALFAGAGWNSDGLTAVSVTDETGCRRFRYQHLSYQTEGLDGGGVEVAPFGFFVVPRSDLPLVLERNVQSRIGDPPLWREMARL